MKAKQSVLFALGMVIGLCLAGLMRSNLSWGQAGAPPTSQPGALPDESPEVTAQRLAILRPDTKKSVPSSVFNIAKLVSRDTGVGSRRDVCDAPTVTLSTLEAHISVLNAGQESHPPHQHNNEEMVILMEGTLDVYIQGKMYKAEKGDIMFFSSNDWHNVKNVGTVPAMYYVLNWKTATTPTTAPAGTPKSAPPRIAD